MCCSEENRRSGTQSDPILNLIKAIGQVKRTLGLTVGTGSVLFGMLFVQTLEVKIESRSLR